MQRTILTDAQFLRSLQSADVHDVEVRDSISYNEGNILSSKEDRIIRNCRLRSFYFPNFSFPNLTIRDCEIGLLEISHGDFSSIQILNCRIHTLKISGDVNCYRLLISESNTIELIGLEQSGLINIDIQAICFYELKVSELRGNQSLEIKSVDKIRDDLSKIILKGSYDKVRITESNLESIFFDVGQISNLGMRSVTVRHIRTFGTIITSGNFLELNVSDMDFSLSESTASELIIRGGEYTNISFSSGANHSLFFEAGLEGNCTVGKMSFSLFSIFLISIKDTDIKELFLNDITIVKEFILNTVCISNLFTLESTTLNDSKFYNVDLSKAVVRFLKSSLSNAQVINVQWPQGYQFYEYQEELKKLSKDDKIIKLYALKESYRQMKVLSLAQHNKIDSLDFQKHELNTFWKITMLKTRKNFGPNIGNWFILGSNKLFSDFGQSIWLPLLWLGSIHLILFGLLVYFKFGIYPSLGQWGTDLTRDMINGYFFTLLPTHTAFINIDGTMKPIGGFIDFLIRIFSGYFIYYFISSSRKYHQ
jgi:hypothetical protein